MSKSIHILGFKKKFHPKNVKTAEPIGPKFCVGPRVTQGEIYR